MKMSQFTDQQIAFAVQQAEAGVGVEEVCRKLGISQQTFYRWKMKFSGLGVAEVRRLKLLEEENKKLKALVAEALRRAIESRRPVGQDLLHHSDRGCQYTSDAYQQILKTMGIACSMSRVGECYDNAVAERFFWSLKHEWTKHETFADLEAARLSVFKYVETFYNPVRLHQTLGYKSSNQFEAEYAPVLAA